MLYGPTLIFPEYGPHFEEEVGLEERFVYAAVRPDAEQASAVTVAKPIGDLLDCRLLEIVGERRLSDVRRVAGQNVTSRVRHARERG